ncbi:MAG: OB-fold domain-containing protein [Gammaproteobacteria bacterium]|nr:OB-fold domain-containing protein [Gammaproteobacteria bacterium]
MTQVSINENILELSDDGPRLLGMRCKTCDNHVFPFQKGCPKCAGTDVEPVKLGTRGTLWAWTIQGFPPKAPPYLGETDPEKFRPYGVGYVELPGQAKIESRLTESDPTKLAEGMEMELTLEPVGKDEDGNDIVTYAFKPI